MTFVTFSTDGSRLWGLQSTSPAGPWIHSGETHCRGMLEQGIAQPVGEIAERITACADYQRQRDAAASEIRARTGCEAWQSVHAARAYLAERGIQRPAGAPSWL